MSPFRSRFTPGTVAGLYLLTSLVWIAFSDRLLFLFSPSSSAALRLSILKGWLFVVLTAGLLYCVLRRMTTDLGRSETRYQELFENASDIIFTHDLSGRFTALNKAGERCSGYTREEALALNVAQVVASEHLEITRAMLTRKLAGDAPTVYEIDLVTKSGGRVPLEVSTQVIEQDGQPVGVQGIARDITERRRTEQQLRLQAAALEAAANAIVITDREGRIEWVNPAFTLLTGHAVGEVSGQTPRVLKSGQHDDAFYAALWRTILAGEVWHGEMINRRRDGSLYTERETITPVRDKAGAVTHFVSIKQDVTPFKRAAAELALQRETLYQSEKLAAMGQLLAGVAHELNNPLAVVTGRAHLLRERMGDGPLRRQVEQIGEAGDRCARIVRNFLALARQYPPERHAVVLNQIVREAVELLAYPLRVDNVEVAYDLAEDLPRLWADPHQLQQVVVNLVTNAHQAMREVPRPERRLLMATRSLPELWGVRLEVADTGPGIPPVIRRRLFEPFFTTKPPGQGTGLGLSLCRGIVEGHGGTIGVESEPGQGARFWVELPLGAPGVAAESPAGESTGAVREKRILVVDDEAEVMGLLVEILATDGHQVDSAANGIVALERLRTHTYDLILSDIRMPDLDGPGFYREVRTRWPDLARRFVFFTGDALDPATRALIEETGIPSVGKPFTVAEVRRVLQQVLQAR